MKQTYAGPLTELKPSKSMPITLAKKNLEKCQYKLYSITRILKYQNGLKKLVPEIAITDR